jgi:RNA polymerase sigma-70 factor (ECF subfamily)
MSLENLADQSAPSLLDSMSETMGLAPDIENIVAVHYAPLYRFAIGLSRCAHTAADLTQQTFYLWATRGHQLRDPTKVKPWLYTTLRREFLRLHRLEARRSQEVTCDDFENMAAETAHAMDAVDSGAVLAALQSLREMFRAPLVMYYIEELSYREIAEILHTPIGTVMSRLSRGKVMLRKLLENRAGGLPAEYSF